LSAAAGAQSGAGSQEFKFWFSLLYSLAVQLFFCRKCVFCGYIIVPVAVVSEFLEALMNLSVR